MERAGVSAAFSELAWSQVEAEFAGETSLEQRLGGAGNLATATVPDAERYKTEYLQDDRSGHDLDLSPLAYLDVELRSSRARLPAARAFGAGSSGSAK